MSLTFAYAFEGNVYINLTNRCCNNCQFCIRNDHEGIGDSGSLWLSREPSVEEAVTATLPLLPDAAEIVFCGYGESTYRVEDLVRIAKRLRQVSSLPIRLNTNGLGSLINQRDIAPSLISAIDTVSISLNAPTAASYQQVSRSIYGEQAFSAILDFAARCKSLGLATVFTVVDTLSAEDIAASKALSDSMGIPLRIRQLI